MIYRNHWRNGTIIAQSSEHPQFPAEYSQDDTPALMWRSRHGTGSGNGRFVVAASSNQLIDFDLGGGELTATITAGTYTGATLATEIKAQLDTAGTATFAVTYSETTGAFTISLAAGNFSLTWQSGTHTATNAGVLLGFGRAADSAGADTYTSTTMVIHTSESIDCDFGAAQTYDFMAILGHNLTSSASITVQGADDAAMTTNVVSDTITYNSTNVYAFLATARTKRYIRVVITDVANPSGFVQVAGVVVGSYWEPNRDFGPYSEGETDETEVELSPSANLFVVQERPKMVVRELEFKGLNAAAIAELRLLLAEVGVSKALILCTDSTMPNTTCHWMRLRECNPPRREGYGYWTWSAPMEEVL
jgi:hypothetical protein